MGAMKAVRALGAAAFLLLPLTPAFAQSADRFPRPEFQKAYKEPKLQKPAPRSAFMEYFDVVVLVAMLGAATYYSLKVVSRKAIFILSVVAVLYFGFYREGCVCPIGSIQNVAQGLGSTGYVVPGMVMLLFLLPLIFSLFVGRVFCASVCPLGAAQEMVIIKPIDVPKGVKHFLGILPYVYLGTAVVLAYTGADYIICRWDPFIGFFRMGANFNMFIWGGLVLAIGTVVARPYCRFLCPYSVLLKWTSFLSKWHLKTTPTECIQCRLCESSCPFDHLHKPTLEKDPEPRGAQMKRVGMILAAMPLLLGAGIGLGHLAHVSLARFHPTVRLAERVAAEKQGLVEGTTEESAAFYESPLALETLLKNGDDLRNRIKTGSMALGAWIGLVVACKLLHLSVRRKRTDYEPDRGDCYSCARCSDACSVGRVPGVPVGTMRVELRFKPQAAQETAGGRQG
jgi:NosR/NirI family nitrous oxide reductase transcriptional regulator